MSENIRSYNVGASDYSKHKIQPWDIWIDYVLNPFDADLLKRDLRHKSSDSRKLDYEKMIHISKERIRQIKEDENVFVYKKREHKFSIDDICKCYELSDVDSNILRCILTMEHHYDDLIKVYKTIIKLCEEGIEEENNKEKINSLKCKIHDENYLNNAIEDSSEKITNCIMENKK